MSYEAVVGYRETFASSTTWTMTHNLNTSTPVVDCWVGGEKVLPQSVVATSANVVTITFSTAQAGEAFVA